MAAGKTKGQLTINIEGGKTDSRLSWRRWSEGEGRMVGRMREGRLKDGVKG